MYGASLDLQAYLAIGGERMLQPISRLDAGNPMSGTVYMSEDGPWVTLTMPDTDRWWPIFAPLVELDVDDPRFDTHDKRCGANRLEMMQVLEAAFRRKPAAHWRAHVPGAPALGRHHRELRLPGRRRRRCYRNRYLLELDDPSLGKQTIARLPDLHERDAGAALRGRRRRGASTAPRSCTTCSGSPRTTITALRDAGTIGG